MIILIGEPHYLPRFPALNPNRSSMIGETVSHYRITKQLGASGLGVIYEAVHTNLDRTVALKYLPPESTRDPEAKARSIHEPKAVSTFDRRDVCTAHEFRGTDDGRETGYGAV